MNTNETAGVKPALPAPPLLSEEQFSTACEVVGKLHDYACASLGKEQQVCIFRYLHDVRAIVYLPNGDSIEAKTLGALLEQITEHSSKANEVRAQFVMMRIAKLKAELAEMEASA